MAKKLKLDMKKVITACLIADGKICGKTTDWVRKKFGLADVKNRGLQSFQCRDVGQVWPQNKIRRLEILIIRGNRRAVLKFVKALRGE